MVSVYIRRYGTSLLTFVNVYMSVIEALGNMEVDIFRHTVCKACKEGTYEYEIVSTNSEGHIVGRKIIHKSGTFTVKKERDD